MFGPPLPFHAAIVCFHRCPQTGVIGARGRRLQITVITRNDLFRENSHACHFVLECGGSDASATLGNGALQLISNTLMLIVRGSRCSRRTPLQNRRWVFCVCAFFFFFFFSKLLQRGVSCPPFDNDNARCKMSVCITSRRAEGQACRRTRSATDKHQPHRFTGAL